MIPRARRAPSRDPIGRARYGSGPGTATPLGRAFFDRRTVRVARDLLGQVLTARGPRGARSVRIVETEAYVASDPANHAYRGRTRRNRSMFGPPGTLYVYRIHQVVCANLVTRPGEAVLLRAGEPWERALDGSASGPGRLCRSLGFTIADDGKDVTQGKRFLVRAGPVQRGRVWVGPRVGISRARLWPLRFALADSPYVSRPLRAISAAWPTRTRADGRSRRSRTRRRRPSAGGTNAAHTAGR